MYRSFVLLFWCFEFLLNFLIINNVVIYLGAKLIGGSEKQQKNNEREKMKRKRTEQDGMHNDFRPCLLRYFVL